MLAMNISWGFLLWISFVLIMQWHDEPVPSKETYFKLNLFIGPMWCGQDAGISKAVEDLKEIYWWLKVLPWSWECMDKAPNFTSIKPVKQSWINVAYTLSLSLHPLLLTSLHSILLWLFSSNVPCSLNIRISDNIGGKELQIVMIFSIRSQLSILCPINLTYRM